MNTLRLAHLPAGRRRQQGATTLLITVIIVLLISLLTFTMTRTTVLENRMTASELSSKQAFHAAQAGLDFALQKIITNELDELNGACSETAVDAATQSPTFQLLFGSDAPECPSNVLGLQTKSVIRSVGRSGDGAAIRILEVRVDLEREWLSSAPFGDTTGRPPPAYPGAIVGRDAVALAGTANAAPCASVEACQALDTPGNPKPDISDLDQKLIVSGGTIEGGDTGVRDSRLLDQHKDANRDDLSSLSADAFFEQVLGMDKDTYKAGAKVVSAGESLGDVNVNPAVWYDGDLRLQSGTLGSPEKPITLVINGDLAMLGNVTIWGLVYMIGNDFSAGTTKIFGQLVAENGISVTGNASVFFNEDLAKVAPLDALAGDPATVLGEVKASFDANSWRELFSGS
ncbi:MAG: PilX N-terminal domain-containing pilus assembly protein [Wenzhouxiangella sp.]